MMIDMAKSYRLQAVTTLVPSDLGIHKWLAEKLVFHDTFQV